jgi:mRNA interferase RelE/StbE
MSFNVIVHKHAVKAISRFSEDDQKRILAALHELKSDPFFGDVKPLKPLKGLFRRRIGEYRIIFSVNFEQSEVIIFKVDVRESAYETL